MHDKLGVGYFVPSDTLDEPYFCNTTNPGTFILNQVLVVTELARQDECMSRDSLDGIYSQYYRHCNLTKLLRQELPMCGSQKSVPLSMLHPPLPIHTGQRSRQHDSTTRFGTKQ